MSPLTAIFDRASASAAPGRRRTWIWGLAVLLFLLALYLWAGFYLAPGLVRSLATDWVGNNLHKSIALGDIKVNPVNFTLDASDIAIPASPAPMVAMGHLRIRFSPLSLVQSAYRLTELSMDRPLVRAVIRPDGSLNLRELIPPSKPDSGPQPALRIDDLAIRNGKVAFTDQNLPLRPEEVLSPINLTLKDFHTKVDEGGEFTLQAKSDQDEIFSWQGVAEMAPIASRGRFTVTGLQSATIAKFLGGMAPVALTEGRIGLTADYRFGYDAGVLRFHGAIPDLTLSDLGFDGKDNLFHGAVQARKVAANMLGLDFVMDQKGSPTLHATLRHLVLQDIAIHGTGAAKREAIALADATLDNAGLDYANRQVTMGSLALDRLALAVRRQKNGRMSLMEFLPAPAPGNASPATGAPWIVKLENLGLSNASVHIEDETARPAARFDIAPLSVTLAGVGTDLAAPVNVTLDARINKRASLKVAGTVTPASKSAHLSLALAGMPLRAALPYAPHYPQLNLKTGDLDLHGMLDIPAAKDAVPEFIGNAALKNFGLFETKDKGGALLAWRTLDLSGIKYDRRGVNIARARLVRPTGRIAILPDRTFNFSALATSDSPRARATAARAGKPPMQVKLKELDISNGALDFADYSIEPNFRAPIDALHGRIRNISTAPDAIATIDLKGQVIDRFSPVTVSGTANIPGYDRNTDVKMSFNNIELPIFNPYSDRYAGYAIAKGKLSTQFDYRIVNRALKADHHVTISQLEWGTATGSKDSVTWPIRLATALLKDRNGVIDLDVPVAGSLDDPAFRLGPIVWKILGNILEKIVAAPFDLIGSLFAGANEAQYIDFAPGSAALPAGAPGSLSALAKALAARPELRLDIPTGPATRDEAASIAEARMNAVLLAPEGKKGGEPPPPLSADDLNDRLRDLYRNKLGKRPDFPDNLPAPPQVPGTPSPDADTLKELSQNRWMQGQLIAAFTPAPAELTALGTARATAIRDALLTDSGIDPGRVFLTTAEAGVVKNGRVSVQLKLR